MHKVIEFAMQPIQVRPLYQIASDIRKDWKNVNYAAKPYLDAMSSLDKMSDSYGMDTAQSIVAYFLSNASQWKGETAKAIKKELNAMLKMRTENISEAPEKLPKGWSEVPGKTGPVMMYSGDSGYVKFEMVGNNWVYHISKSIDTFNSGNTGNLPAKYAQYFDDGNFNEMTKIAKALIKKTTVVMPKFNMSTLTEIIREEVQSAIQSEDMENQDKYCMHCNEIIPRAIYSRYNDMCRCGNELYEFDTIIGIADELRKLV